MTNFNIKNVGLTNSYQTAEFDPAGWKELGRTTLAPPTPTDTTLFSSSSGWTGDTSVFTNSGDTMVWDTSVLGEAVVKTITTLTTSGEWVMRFKVTRVSGDLNDGSFLTIGSSSASTSTLARMQNGNGLYPYGIHVAYFANGNKVYIGGSHNTSFGWDSSSTTSVNWSVGDSKWIEVSHASATAFTTKIYSNANFTGTADLTNVASTSGQTLDYDEFAIGTKWTANRKNMIIEDMQIYNGVSDASGASDNILVSSLADKKYYMALASTEGGGSTTRSQSQVQMGSPPSTVTYTGDYSTQVGWTSNNSRISITGGYAYMNNSGSVYGDYIYTPLGLTLSDTAWVADFEYYNIGAINFYPFVLAAGTSLVGDNSVNQDFIAMAESNPNMMQLRYKDGSSNIVSSSNSNTMSTSTPYYCRLIRDGSNLSLKIYTDSARTSQFGSTLTLTISGTVSGLTTLHHSGLNIGGGTSGYSFKVRGTKIWNGVTSLGGVDTGSNYAGSFSNNSNSGGADTPLINDTDISISDTNYTNAFEVGYIANQASEEKLGMFWNVLQSTLGSNNAPNRTESVGKWSHTTSVLDRINWFNRQTGDFASGSELVILGWDPTDNQSENFWEELASVELPSAGTVLSSGTFTAKKYLWVQAFIDSSGGNVNDAFRCGNGSVDTGTNYSYRFNTNGGSDTANSGTVSQNDIGDFSNITNGQFINMFIINIASNEKLITCHINDGKIGVSNVPTRLEIAGKWSNTSDQINIVEWRNPASINYSTKSVIKVWGHN